MIAFGGKQGGSGPENKSLTFSSDGSNNVRSSMFECSKPKLGVQVRLPKDEHVQCPFNVPSTVRRTFNEQIKPL